MRSFNSGDRLLSQPVRLNWAGWTTDTFRLQQAGWSLSAEQNIERMQMTIALRNEREGISGITASVDWNFFEYASGYRSCLPELPVRLMGRQVNINVMGENPYANFRPIDAKPQFVPIQTERRTLEDLVHFAPAMARTQQIIVPEESVDDLMQRILDMQNTSRIERIRAEVREGERVQFTERQKFHAQIISLAA